MEGVFVGVVVFVVFFVILAFLSGQSEVRKAFARHEDRTQWGRSKGLTMVDRPRHHPLFWKAMPGVSSRRVSHLRPFLESSSTAYNFLEGRVGPWAVEVFDLSIIDSESQDRFYGYVAITLNAKTPGFEIRRHTMWDGIASLFGVEDLKTGHEQFDSTFHIKASDSTLLEAIDYELRKRLLSHEHNRWQCNSRYLVVRRDKLCSNEEFGQMLSTALLFAEQAESVRF